MKKQLLFCALLIGLPFLSFAQEYHYVPFPESGAVWSEVYSSEETLEVYERFTMTGEDTLINNIQYHKLYIFYDKIFNKNKAKCVGGIREDEKKRVYFKGDSIIHRYKPFWGTAPPMNEILLYDFSLQIGDTMKINISNLSTGSLRVTNIDTVQIGNNLRKVFKFDHTDASWIEGIGNTRGLLFSSLSLSTGGEHGYLICFLQNETVLYHYGYYDDCFPSTANNEFIKSEFDITVCPNPVNGNSIHFVWGNNELKTLELFDFRGVLIGTLNVAGETMLEYPVGTMQPGIYFYKATCSKGAEQIGKFTIQ
jgi:hypothetical protein